MRSAIASCLVLGVSATDLGSMLHTGHADHADHANFGGDKMERTFTMYKPLPMGEKQLKAAGWTKHTENGCNPHLGYAWTEDAYGVKKDLPMKLYTTEGGQPAGVGTTILGYGEDALPGPQKQWATEKPLVKSWAPNVAHIDVAFRSGDVVCSGAQDALTVGSTLIVNPMGNSSKTLPLTEKEIEQQGWMRGSCFDGMGWHWFLDTSMGNNKLSWKSENLFPVVTMYHEGQINAIFFAATINQVSIPLMKTNEWEPKSLSNDEMCKNICDKDCTFSGLTDKGPWSTQHVYFRDHSSVTCDAKLTCGLKWPFRGNCCETKSDVRV